MQTKYDLASSRKLPNGITELGADPNEYKRRAVDDYQATLKDLTKDFRHDHWINIIRCGTEIRNESQKLGVTLKHSTLTLEEMVAPEPPAIAEETHDVKILREAYSSLKSAEFNIAEFEACLPEKHRDILMEGALVAMLKLGILLGEMRVVLHPAPPNHIQKINSQRRSGGTVSKAIKTVIESVGSPLRAVDILEELNKTHGWFLKNDYIWERKKVRPEKIVTWARFQNVVTEQRKAYAKRLTAQLSRER